METKNLTEKEKLILKLFDSQYRRLFEELILEFGKENKLDKEEIHDLMDLKRLFGKALSERDMEICLEHKYGKRK